MKYNKGTIPYLYVIYDITNAKKMQVKTIPKHKNKYKSAYFKNKNTLYSEKY